MTGPVSSVLLQEVSNEVRRQGLVIWLDKDASYSGFVDDLAAKSATGEISFPVVGFRGSFLELLYKLERYGSGLDKPQLLLHMPGFNEETIRSTPVLELYEPGVRFRKGLDTLVREAAAARVAPAEVTSFLATNPSLEAADVWLSGAVSRSTVGLEAILNEFGPRMLTEALAQPSSLTSRVTGVEEVQTLQNYIHRLTGMDEAWEAFYPAERDEKPLARRLGNVLHWLGGWLLAVEYVHDLRRPPHREELRRLRALAAPQVKACGELLGQLRRDHGDVYAKIADALEGFLADELKAMAPEDLGQVDTFREEENRVLAGAVDALRSNEWSKAKAWAEARQGDKSFWLQREQLRRSAWTLVAEAAEFGETIARHPTPLAGVRSLDEATERYAAGVFEVDRAHRRFEQRRLALLDSRLPQHGALLEVTTSLRRSHRAWADQLAKAFTVLCKEQGFLPSATLQQRNLFEQVVHPLTIGGEKVAVFVVDAFRFEMATELVEELKGAGTSVDLKPRLAELPTITSVGMNVLAPVARDGRLSVAGIFQGFKSGEFTVRTPEERSRSMGMRSAGKPALLLKLSEVCEAKTANLKREVAQNSLIVVHSKEIDDAGEANVGLPTFESTLRLIKAAWHHLQLVGVRSFVFTSDHGFLLRDETSEVHPFGTPRDPKRRHVLDEYPRAEAGMVNVALSSLGYEGLGGYLLFREDTAVFATGNPGASFVHGGNSPQERVIPVLTVTRTRAEQLGNIKYELEVESLGDAFGCHRVRLRLGFAKDTTASLGFAGARTVDLALRVPKRDDVRTIIKEVSGAGTHKTGRLQLPVGDAWTEVFFSLEGPADERVRIEVHHPDNIEKVDAKTPETWFTVSGSSAAPTPTVPTVPPASWAESIEDPLIRAVFEHIDRHGVITEPEATKLLGSPRAFRRFSAVVQVYLPRLPFGLKSDQTESGKRYVRDHDRGDR